MPSSPVGGINLTFLHPHGVDAYFSDFSCLALYDVVFCWFPQSELEVKNNLCRLCFTRNFFCHHLSALIKFPFFELWHRKEQKKVMIWIKTLLCWLLSHQCQSRNVLKGAAHGNELKDFFFASFPLHNMVEKLLFMDFFNIAWVMKDLSFQKIFHNQNVRKLSCLNLWLVARRNLSREQNSDIRLSEESFQHWFSVTSTSPVFVPAIFTLTSIWYQLSFTKAHQRAQEH